MQLCNVTSAELIETFLKEHTFRQIIPFLAKSEKIGLGYSLNLNYKILNIGDYERKFSKTVKYTTLGKGLHVDICRGFATSNIGLTATTTFLTTNPLSLYIG
jgi:hypothetical protein